MKNLNLDAKNKILSSRGDLLRHLNIGDPAGETDSLLEDCRIETTAFSDLFHDRKDLFLGPKGTGKSSIYTFFSKYLYGILRKSKKVFIVKGVAKVGAPIYTDYWQEFATFSDEDFQNFWNILFINLVYRDYVKDKDAFDVTRVAEFESLCLKNGVTLEKDQSDPHIVRHAINKVKSFTAKGSGGPTGVAGELSMEFDKQKDSVKQLERPARIKTREILDYINSYLDFYDHKIWIMLDQLDQAFERHSEIEKRALHALLSETISFNSDRLKLKIFLRDDVFNLVSEYKGIVNLDHLRVSLALKWEEIDLLKLVLKRLLHNEELRGLVVELKEIDEIDSWSKDECLSVFYTLFPARGSKGATFWDYLLREMRDGNDLTTPRDLIFLLDKAREAQLRLISAGEGEETLFSKQSIEKALDQCSSGKISAYVTSEFPYLRESIDKLKLKFNKYDEIQMREVLGTELYEKRLAQLFSVGVLHRRKESNTIWVAPLYQRGLQVRGRRAKTKG